MDFELTTEQQHLRETVIDFARAELNEDVPERDRTGVLPRDLWRACARIGLLGLPVPQEYGGAGVGAVTSIVALEALGYGCTDNGLIFSLNAQMWACETPIAHFGTDEQKQSTSRL